MTIQASLSPQIWPFSLEWLPPEACLVGGAVRDALLERTPEYLDLDFVVPTKAIKIARQLAYHYKAGFVVLDAQRQIARVVFEQATVDIAQQEGDSLETDLQRRDFTINAIAYNPHTSKLIDPLQGVSDLHAGIIRMVSVKNLQDDPLRLLRAYRQASQLGFTIEPATRSVIQSLAPLLGQVSAERIQLELGYLLKSPQGTPWLKAAWEDGLLQTWFPDVAAQGIAQIEAIDQCNILLRQKWLELQIKLQASVSGKLLPWLSLAKLASLVSSAPEAAEAQLWRLKYARAEIRTVVTAVKYLPELIAHANLQMSLREQYFFFQNVGLVFPVLIVLVVTRGVPVEVITPLIERYLKPDDPVAHPQALVTGKDLKEALHLPAGPLVGKLITEIQIAQIEGKIKSRETALNFAAQLVDSL
ncbi:CCA tRNA nucleotidyltransferase [Lyngbya aestuarii]|uniref:CCA tRNA nucleotidyltransferase n=1 Tax=Lyngbya aestuarii TaxID=118322 RepID=UPI00403DDFCC